MKYQAFFFDFDGVLADSVEVKTRAFAMMFESYGAEIQAMVVEHHRNHGGMNRFDKFRHYYKNYLQRTLSENELNGICREFSSLVIDEVVNSQEIPGAEIFLRKCNAVAPCFIVSATPESEIQKIVKRRNIADLFTEILGSPASKTDNLKKLLRKYAYNPDQCIFWGDAESDYLAALTNRVHFIGILPDPDAPLLQKHGDIKWFNNFNQIKDEDLYDF